MGLLRRLKRNKASVWRNKSWVLDEGTTKPPLESVDENDDQRAHSSSFKTQGLSDSFVSIGCDKSNTSQSLHERECAPQYEQKESLYQLAPLVENFPLCHNIDTLQKHEDLLELRQQLRMKDDAISSLRHYMEEEERVRTSRIAMLERKLDQLVEMSCQDCEVQGLASLSSLCNDLPHQDMQMYDTVCKDSLESAALQQLLVRVLAEKDRLKFQNSNLRKITRRRKAQEQRTQDCEGLPALPHRSSSDLDEKVDERDHRSDTRGNRRKVSEFTSSFGSHAVCPVKYRLTPKGYNVEPPPAYVATYTPSSFDPGHDNGELFTVLSMLYSQVWWMVREEEERQYDCPQEGYEGDFTSSSLARYLAARCKDMSSGEEVQEWCMSHVKVQTASRRSS